MKEAPPYAVAVEQHPCDCQGCHIDTTIRITIGTYQPMYICQMHFGSLIYDASKAFAKHVENSVNTASDNASLAKRFLQLGFLAQHKIIKDFDIMADSEIRTLNDQQLFLEFFKRVRDRGELPILKALVDKHSSTTTPQPAYGTANRCIHCKTKEATFTTSQGLPFCSTQCQLQTLGR